MTKRFYLIAFILTSVIGYGQNVTFTPNTNRKAKALKQMLNKNKDSLILESTKIIEYVDILNDDFLKSMKIDSTLAKVAIDELPLGNYLIVAKIDKKRIVMSLDKSEDRTSLTDTEKSKTQPKLPFHEILNNERTFYWVVYERNASFGSSKSMSLEKKPEVTKLIKRIKLELKSDVAKHNRLTVYEIYNKSKFMTKQFRYSDYYKSKKSKFFNVVPIYDSSENENTFDP